MPDTAPAPADADLATLRAEIDALDDTMHDLLMRRAAVVGRLAASRAKGGSSPLRPGREATVLRRLLARHEGPLPRERIVRIWREVFMAHTAIQGAFSAAVFAPAPDSGLARLAREHFGPTAAIRVHPTASRALSAASEGEAAVAVLPAPAETDGATTAWWARLDVPRLQVVARLPFVSAPGGPVALVVAPMPPDASGQDRSLLAIEAAADSARGRIAQALADAGLRPEALIVLRAEEAVLALADVEGLLRPDDARLASLPFPRCSLLGAYAAPVVGDAP